VFLYFCAASLLIAIFAEYHSLKSWENNTGFLIFMCIYLLYPASMIIIALLPVTRGWLKEPGPAVRVIFNPVIIIIFLLLMGIGPALLKYIDSRGMYIACVISNVLTSSSTQDNWPYALVDDKAETAWIPWANPSGRNEWLDLILDEPTDICIVEIFPGAYSSSDKNIFTRYNRVKSGYLLFPDGLKIPFILEDANSAQHIILNPVRTDRLRIVITDVYSGSIEQVLHVSGIKLIMKTRRFK